jgi:hypothetical protein
MNILTAMFRPIWMQSEYAGGAARPVAPQVSRAAEAIQQAMDMWSEIIDTSIDPLSV